MHSGVHQGGSEGLVERPLGWDELRHSVKYLFGYCPASRVWISPKVPFSFLEKVIQSTPSQPCYRMCSLCAYLRTIGEKVTMGKTLVSTRGLFLDTVSVDSPRSRVPRLPSKRVDKRVKRSHPSSVLCLHGCAYSTRQSTYCHASQRFLRTHFLCKIERDTAFHESETFGFSGHASLVNSASVGGFGYID